MLVFDSLCGRVMLIDDGYSMMDIMMYGYTRVFSFLLGHHVRRQDTGVIYWAVYIIKKRLEMRMFIVKSAGSLDLALESRAIKALRDEQGARIPI